MTTKPRIRRICSVCGKHWFWNCYGSGASGIGLSAEQAFERWTENLHWADYWRSKALAQNETPA